MGNWKNMRRKKVGPIHFSSFKDSNYLYQVQPRLEYCLQTVTMIRSHWYLPQENS